MTGYTDELSIKLTARDEMSAKLRETRKQLSGLEKDMQAARKQVQDTGSPEAVRELKRLESAWESAAKEQADAARGLKDARQAMEALKKEAGKTADAVEDVAREAGKTGDATTRMARKTSHAAGETKKLESASSRLSGRMGKLGIAAGAAAAGGIAAVAAGSLVAGKALISMTKGAMADEASQKKLAGQLKTTTKATGDQVAKLEDWISRQGELTGYADDQMRPALARLANSFGSIGKAKDMTRLAMDIATAKGKNLADVSNALAKANDGQVGALKKLGVTLGPQAQNLIEYQKAQSATVKAQVNAASAMDQYGPKSKQYAAAMAKVTEKQALANGYAADGIDVMGELGKQFGGQTSANAKTLEGRMKRLSLIMDETRESIGAGVIPVATKLAAGFQDKVLPAIRETAAKVLPKLRDGFKVVTDAIEENRPGLTRIGVVLGAVGKVVIEKVIPALAKVQFKAWATGITVIGKLGTAAMDAAPSFIRFSATGVKAFRGLLKAANIVLSGILNTAARTMGWIPGIGPKIKKAASAFATMKDKSDDALGKVELGLKKAADGVEKWNAKARKAEAAKLRGDIKDLESKIATAKKKLSDPKLTKPEASKVRADIRDLEAKAAKAAKALKAIPDTHTTTLKLADPSKVQGVANKLAAMNGNTITVKFSGAGGFGLDASVSGGGSAVARAMATTRNVPNTCGATVGRWLGGKGPHGPTAIRAWDSAPASVKHRGDWSPPAGVPVYWRGGSAGHVALSLGGGRIRSTDWPRRGVTGTTTIESLTRAWGKHYEGWARPFARGGRIHGPGTGTSDSVPIRGSNGEFMVRARSARAIGYGRLDHMNRTGRIPNLPPIVSAPNVTVQAPSSRGPLVGQMNVYPSGQLDFEAGLAREARRQAREEARYAHARGA